MDQLLKADVKTIINRVGFELIEFSKDNYIDRTGYYKVVIYKEENNVKLEYTIESAIYTDKTLNGVDSEMTKRCLFDRVYHFCTSYVRGKYSQIKTANELEQYG